MRRCASPLRSMPSVSKIEVTCFSTALSVITSCSAIPLLERPCAISSSTSRSRGESSSSGSIRRRPAEHLPDDLGVEHGPALADRADGVRERVEVADPVLEQVADALGAVADQVDGVALLDVLGEHEDLGVRVLRADLHRGAQAVVGVGRRHLDVDDRDVGPVRADLAAQVDRVARLADDVEARLLEQPAQPLAEEQLVLADDHPHGGVAAIHVRRGPPRPQRCSHSAPICEFASAALGTKPSAPERRSSEPTRSSSSAEVRTTRGAGRSSPSAAATAKPSMSGRCTSSSTASGRSRRHAASAVKPSVASPMTE